MVGANTVISRRELENAQHIDQKGKILIRPVREILRTVRPFLIVGEEVALVFGDHPGT